MDIIDAAKNGDIIRVRELLDSDADPNIRDNYGYTALMEASDEGHTEIVQLLLDYGAKPNIRNKFDDTALILASHNGHTEIVKLLLDRGANPNIRDNYGFTALMKASHNGNTDIVKMLLDNGVDINITDDEGETALMFASRGGDTIIVGLLLNSGAKPNIQNISGYTALLMASDEGHTEIVGLLLDYGANPDIIDNDADTASMLAESKGHDGVVRLIRDHINLQRAMQNLAFMKSVNTRLGVNAYNKTGFDLYREIADRHAIKYNPSVNMRMQDEKRRDPLTKSKQRLATGKALQPRLGEQSTFNIIDESNIMENISRHLSSMRPDPGIQRRIQDEERFNPYTEWLEDFGQYGSGKRSGKRTKKKRNYRFY